MCFMVSLALFSSYSDLKVHLKPGALEVLSALCVTGSGQAQPLGHTFVSHGSHFLSTSMPTSSASSWIWARDPVPLSLECEEGRFGAWLQPVLQCDVLNETYKCRHFWTLQERGTVTAHTAKRDGAERNTDFLNTICEIVRQFSYTKS